MITNRSLIDMIGGRAAAGDSNPSVPFAAQPLVVRALQRATIVVGAAGLCAALVVGFGDEVMSAAASAAVSGGGVPGSGAGSGTDGDATVEELAASDAVEAVADVTHAAIDATTGAIQALPTSEVEVHPEVVEDLVAETAALVTPAPAPKQAAAPPTTTTTAPPTMVAASVNEPGSVEAIITEVFGAHADSAIGVARCESGLNPGAISRGGGNWGLFQINKVHRGRVESMGYRWEDVLDARVNSIVAYSIFREQGWGPWGCRHAA